MSSEKENVQQLVVEYNVLMEYASALQRTIENLTAMLREAEVTRKELETLGSIKDEAELLVPIGPLAFIRTTVRNVENVILNLGAGVYRELKVEEALTKIDEYMKVINEELERTTQAYRRVTARIAEIENILRSKATAESGRG